MSTSSNESPAVSGLDYDDTALTLALPGSSPNDRKQAVGWPPVRAYRRNAMREEGARKLVKVAVDGAPYLRKVDLAAHGGYEALLRALYGMFAPCLAVVRGEGELGCRLVDASTGAEYVPTYEDRDGDWMLVGDVPWKMFVESCKRIRLMKGSEGEGANLASRPSSQ